VEYEGNLGSCDLLRCRTKVAMIALYVLRIG
jgi:hypothetical protein